MEISIERGDPGRAQYATVHASNCPCLTDPIFLGDLPSTRSAAVAATLSGLITDGAVTIFGPCVELPRLSEFESFSHEVHMRSAEATANALRYLIPLVELHHDHPALAGRLSTTAVGDMAEAFDILQQIVTETVDYPVEVANRELCQPSSLHAE